ncbi:hypothetical protein [Helicobacter sp. 13S00477-4]|uniref:hypothetical protein n=1 Tax=Helicobacter sp. 13S00477-4 TaxID=1905759 RepID=UPI000BA72329|nr:hypothetical protein [Helicobacter sp. 13S00477-4]PAF51995.1 hypothetical protein BKH44_04865 [Helicobacter sp. 13S00477-4]
MLSELIAQFIEEKQNLEASIHHIDSIKSQIDSVLSNDFIEDKINNNPYLKSNEFIQKVAKEVDINPQDLPEEKLKPILCTIIDKSINPQSITQELLAQDDFKQNLNNKIAIEARSAIASYSLDKYTKIFIKNHIDSMVTQSLKDNNIDKYRLESALSLQIVYLNTLSLIAELAYSDTLKHNIYKRI